MLRFKAEMRNKDLKVINRNKLPMVMQITKKKKNLKECQYEMTTATYWYYCEMGPVTHLSCRSHMQLIYAVRTMPALFLLHYSSTRTKENLLLPI